MALATGHLSCGEVGACSKNALLLQSPISRSRSGSCLEEPHPSHRVMGEVARLQIANRLDRPGNLGGTGPGLFVSAVRRTIDGKKAKVWTEN